MSSLDEKWKKRIDEIAMSIPRWDDHWRDYKKRHPEEPMPKVMKKASFTRRMMVAKQVNALIREIFEEVEKELFAEQAEKNES